MTAQPTAPTFAAYDDQAIWGVGATPEAAVNDATQWVNREDAERLADSVDTAPMSTALAARVATQGGNCAFTLGEDGVLYLDAELDEDGDDA